MTSDKPKPTALQKLWKELLEPILFAIVVTQFIVTLVGVEGRSMMPNLRDHERVVVPKYETWLHKVGIGDFKRGDIVIFKPPREVAQEVPSLKRRVLGFEFRPFLIKRIIALGGDKVSIKGGEVTVNGQPLDASWTTDYWKAQGCWDTESDQASHIISASGGMLPSATELTVPKGQYFVMGDNRTPNGSEDSRMFGPVPLREIAGRAALIIWPIMRKAEAKYDCNSGLVSSLSGDSQLNWRVLNRPAAFEQVPQP